MRAPSRSPARISSKPGSISVGTCRPSRAISIVCWVRSRRVPTARSTWRLASCAPRARACVRPLAVSATGWDGLLLSMLAALATDSACRATTNKRSTSACIVGLLPLVPTASEGHLGLAQIALDASALGYPGQALHVLLHLPPCAVGVSCPDQCQQSATRTGDDVVRRWPGRDHQVI